MRLKSAKEKFHGEWVAFKFTNENKEEGQVLSHDKSRHKLLDRLIKTRKLRKAQVYITFAGKMIPDEYAIILFSH